MPGTRIDSRETGRRYSLSDAASLARARADLRTRLDLNRSEVEQAILTRVYSIEDPAGVADPSYVHGLHTSVATALDYALEAIERGEERTPSPPPQLLAQARLAAHSGVGLDTVLRRYLAGYALLDDFLAQEIAAMRLSEGEGSPRLLRPHAAILDRLIAAVTAEYERESSGRPKTKNERVAKRVKGLLDGELLDASPLNYRFDNWHVGIVAADRTLGSVHGLAQALDCQSLLVSHPTCAWAWLGSSREPDSSDVCRRLAEFELTDAPTAVGEPAEGMQGWRLTHRQAVAALPVAVDAAARCVRYAEVAMVAAALQDDLLSTSLTNLYLRPLELDRDGGEGIRETLRAYFAAARNISSAAAALRLTRNTVSNRLKAAERRLGKPLNACGADLEIALRLDERRGAESGGRLGT